MWAVFISSLATSKYVMSVRSRDEWRNANLFSEIRRKTWKNVQFLRTHASFVFCNAMPIIVECNFNILHTAICQK